MPTVLTWNIRHGGGARGMPRIAMTVLDLAPDVAVLVEWRPPTGGQILGTLADHGWQHHAATSPGPGRNGVLVASRHPLEPVAAAGALASDPRWVGVRIPSLALGIGAVHAPCTGRIAGRRTFWRGVVREADARRDDRFLIIGDFNIPASEPVRSDPLRGYLRDLSALGYVDVWSRANPGRSSASWVSPTGASARLDQAWASRVLAPSVHRADLYDGPRAAGLSDHGVLVVGFD